MIKLKSSLRPPHYTFYFLKNAKTYFVEAVIRKSEKGGDTLAISFIKGTFPVFSKSILKNHTKPIQATLTCHMYSLNRS